MHLYTCICLTAKNVPDVEINIQCTCNLKVVADYFDNKLSHNDIHFDVYNVPHLGDRF